ncbi:sarcosine oxidase subunit gamma [Burkholderia contaminans]|uniref:Sarcosine oxidase subunit gamma n=1 Tax=Burkholderia contaminans TaxID=488447 RepID=A0A3N8PTD5_9BURK|nr:sarcosine oxidase subunit gamma family protein [Burkholderia contaminans]RQT14882.1 hypothetical protein DF051_17120 [Burkholderia contaminans]
MVKLAVRSIVSPQFMDARDFPIRTSGLNVFEMPLGGIIRVQGCTDDDAFRASVATSLGADLPSAERMSCSAESRIAWAGPNEYLCFCELEAEERLVFALTSALAGQFATVTLVSDSRIGFSFTGNDAHALIAKGCAIDMHPADFTVGRVVTTRFAGLHAMLMKPVADQHVVYFDIAYVEFVLKWIQDAAREFLEPAPDDSWTVR